jgi:C-terminal processing protease CtpA/Prc
MDYAHATVYFSQGSKYTPPGIDVVGLTLRPEADGRYTVIGIADYNGAPSVPEVKSGDVLVMVDGARVSGGTMGQAWSLLGGSPGDTRTLIMERDGKQFTVKAPVRRFLPAVTSDGEKARTRSRRKN